MVHIIAWRRTGDKPLSEPMEIYFTDVNMRYLALRLTLLSGWRPNDIVSIGSCNDLLSPPYPMLAHRPLDSSEYIQ